MYIILYEEDEHELRRTLKGRECLAELRAAVALFVSSHL